MEIFDKARELGKLLLETEQGKKFYDKKYIFDGDLDARRLLFEYSRDRENAQVRAKSGLSEEEIAALQNELSEKGKRVMENQTISDLFKAEEEFYTLVNEVVSILRATVEGDNQFSGGCSGSCGSCGGCH